MEFEKPVPVQDIALTSQTVPPEFVVPAEVQTTLSHKFGDEDLQLPVIDMAPLLDSKAALQDVKNAQTNIGRACEDWGFFQVVNHGIPERLLDQVLVAVQKFFSLPLADRQKYAMRPGSNQGYGRVMKPKIRPWSDAFRHSVRPKPESDQDFRPKSPPDYRAIMDEYTCEVARLSKKLTSVMSEYLGLEPLALQNSLAEELDKYPAITITVNLYPKCPEPDRVLGIYPHSDAGALTVLHHNGEGLQVLQNDRWVTVKYEKNALVVNVANQIEVLSNGRFRSSKHRAVVSSGSSRISIAAFCLPESPNVAIGPIKSLVDEQHPSAYPTVTYGEYSSQYFSRNMEKNPLSLLGHPKPT